jgi:hypothetical protein
LQVATGLGGDERVIKIAVPDLVEGDALEISGSGSATSGTGSGAPAAGSAAK